MKTLLIQLRDDPRTLEWEKKSVLAASELPETSIVTVNMTERDIVAGDLEGVSAVIIGGSHFSVADAFPRKDALRSFIRKAAENRTHLLGVCFGAQLIADTLGGMAMPDEDRKEVGTYIMERIDPGFEEPLFAGMPKKFSAQCNHHDRIVRLPTASVILAKSDKCPVQAYKMIGTNIYGVQFHPERSKEAFAEVLQKAIEGLPQEEKSEKLPSLKKALKSLKASDTYGIVKNFLKMTESK